MFCAVWYNLYNLKNESLQKLKAFNFTKSNTPPWVFFTFFKLDKWTNGTKLRNASHIYAYIYINNVYKCVLKRETLTNL